MTNDLRAFSVIITISVVTIGLRYAPILLMKRLEKNGYLRYLGECMPPGVMILLVLYTLKDKDVTRYPYCLPDLMALALSVLIYWKSRNALLAIGAGLASYIFAVNLVVFN
ncbi:branched-chain amino acid transporter permease [Burkholderia cenocepacia]|uniref:Branched-chain amino acid transporter n=1 Tax=Burkholderia cenocepacia TaxID=95486 RepID=A0A3S9N677_9BURK|nr:AzlD domain-containing protein [Burkholderia cenocepacia]AZQ51180.1 branched-chain amino acid transporter [Burkholderia cenocepacia]